MRWKGWRASIRAMKTDTLLPALQDLGTAALALADTLVRTIPTVLEALLHVAACFARVVHVLLDSVPPH